MPRLWLVQPLSPAITQISKTTSLNACLDDPRALLSYTNLFSVAFIVQNHQSPTPLPGQASMEAASARMAARDRYGGFDTAPTSQLQRFICRNSKRARIYQNTNISMHSKCLRSPELRTEPRAKSRDLRPDQCEERLSVSASDDTAIHIF
jgi:hypothetical protein